MSKLDTFKIDYSDTWNGVKDKLNGVIDYCAEYFNNKMNNSNNTIVVTQDDYVYFKNPVNYIINNPFVPSPGNYFSTPGSVGVIDGIPVFGMTKVLKTPVTNAPIPHASNNNVISMKVYFFKTYKVIILIRYLPGNIIYNTYLVDNTTDNIINSHTEPILDSSLDEKNLNINMTKNRYDVELTETSDGILIKYMMFNTDGADLNFTIHKLYFYTNGTSSVTNTIISTTSLNDENTFQSIHIDYNSYLLVKNESTSDKYRLRVYNHDVPIMITEFSFNSELKPFISKYDNKCCMVYLLDNEIVINEILYNEGLLQFEMNNIYKLEYSGDLTSSTVVHMDKNYIVLYDSNTKEFIIINLLSSSVYTSSPLEISISGDEFNKPTTGTYDYKPIDNSLYNGLSIYDSILSSNSIYFNCSSTIGDYSGGARQYNFIIELSLKGKYINVVYNFLFSKYKNLFIYNDYSTAGQIKPIFASQQDSYKNYKVYKPSDPYEQFRLDTTYVYNFRHRKSQINWGINYNKNIYDRIFAQLLLTNDITKFERKTTLLLRASYPTNYTDIIKSIRWKN